MLVRAIEADGGLPRWPGSPWCTRCKHVCCRLRWSPPPPGRSTIRNV